MIVTEETFDAVVAAVDKCIATATTPTSPGAGWYLIDLDQKAAEGHYVNTGVYKKPPVTQTFKKTTTFRKPGSASISASEEMRSVELLDPLYGTICV